MPLDDIFDIESLSQLESHLRRGGVSRTRNALLARFHKLADYQNARDWNRLVRVCEVLAIVGWDKHEEAVDTRMIV